jgi:hypothetical protein
MTPEEFRTFGYQIVDFIADYRARLSERPVMATSAPGTIKTTLPASPPSTAEPFDAILRDLDRIILPGLTHWQHPQFFGYFPCNGTLASVLGDYLSTGLGVLGLAWQSSPALTELEEVVTDWLRQMLGLSGAWQGVIQDTASTSTLVALLCARERASDYSLGRGGLQGRAESLIVYASAHSHSSVDKAALLAGFGRDHVRLVPCDEHYAMRVDSLDQAVERCRERLVRQADLTKYSTLDAHPWTIADLADEVGISRSALVERFSGYLAEPPMTYLTRWRLKMGGRIAQEDVAWCRRDRHRHRLRIRSGLQPRVQARVWPASRPLPEGSQGCAPAHTGHAATCRDVRLSGRQLTRRRRTSSRSEAPPRRTAHRPRRGCLGKVGSGRRRVRASLRRISRCPPA